MNDAYLVLSMSSRQWLLAIIKCLVAHLKIDSFSGRMVPYKTVDSQSDYQVLLQPCSYHTLL
jgi:hypothetical protein